MESKLKFHVPKAERDQIWEALQKGSAFVTLTIPLNNGSSYAVRMLPQDIKIGNTRDRRTDLYEISIYAMQLLEVRGTGKTTKQLQDAPKGSIFVWCNDNVFYAQELRSHLKRNDITVMPLRWLDRYEHVAGRLVVVDHAAKLTPRQYETIREHRYQRVEYTDSLVPPCMPGSCDYGLTGRCLTCNGLR